MKFSENLKALREKEGKTQEELSAALGLSKSTISMYENGKREPDFEMQEAIADYFNVALDRLMGREIYTPGEGYQIPILGSVPAGVPVEAVENIIGYEEITQALAHTGEFFGLKVKGDSMESDIHEGDILIIRKQSFAESGDIVVAMINGNEATVKKIRITPEGIMLIPNNGNYPPMFYTKEQIENLPITIIGKLAELHRSY